MFRCLRSGVRTCVTSLLQGSLLGLSFLQTWTDKLVLSIAEWVTMLKAVQSMVQLCDLVCRILPTGGGEGRGGAGGGEGRGGTGGRGGEGRGLYIGDDRGAGNERKADFC